MRRGNFKQCFERMMCGGQNVASGGLRGCSGGGRESSGTDQYYNDKGTAWMC